MSQGFWTDINTEPKRSHRWVMFIGGIPQWVIKATNKPNYSVTEVKHQYINHTFKYPGRVEWNDLEVTLVDPINPDAAKTMENIIRAAGYNFPTDPNDVTTISKKRAVSALGSVVIQQFGPDDEVIESWELVNGWVKNVDNGTLTYENDEMVELKLTIAYDFAFINRDGDFGIDQGILPANA